MHSRRLDQAPGQVRPVGLGHLRAPLPPAREARDSAPAAGEPRGAAVPHPPHTKAARGGAPNRTGRAHWACTRTGLAPAMAACAARSAVSVRAPGAEIGHQLQQLLLRALLPAAHIRTGCKTPLPPCSTQAELLRAGFRNLRDGGSLVYCTCSFARAQNEDVVGAAVACRRQGMAPRNGAEDDSEGEWVRGGVTPRGNDCEWAERGLAPTGKA